LLKIFTTDLSQKCWKWHFAVKFSLPSAWDLAGFSVAKRAWRDL